jgi:hypothetical protein
VHAWVGLLKQGLIRRIVDSRSTNILDKNWIPRQDHMSTITSQGESELVKVLELIDHNFVSWRED